MCVAGPNQEAFPLNGRSHDESRRNRLRGGGGTGSGSEREREAKGGKKASYIGADTFASALVHLLAQDEDGKPAVAMRDEAAKLVDRVEDDPALKAPCRRWPTWARKRSDMTPRSWTLPICDV